METNFNYKGSQNFTVYIYKNLKDTTSHSGLNQIKNILMFNNPVHSVLGIKSQGGNSIEKVIIRDQLFRTVKEIKLNDREVQINVEDLESGIYYLNIQLESGINTIQKILISR